MQCRCTFKQTQTSIRPDRATCIAIRDALKVENMVTPFDGMETTPSDEALLYAETAAKLALEQIWGTQVVKV